MDVAAGDSLQEGPTQDSVAPDQEGASGGDETKGPETEVGPPAYQRYDEASVGEPMEGEQQARFEEEVVPTQPSAEADAAGAQPDSPVSDASTGDAQTDNRSAGSFLSVVDDDANVSEVKRPQDVEARLPAEES